MFKRGVDYDISYSALSTLLYCPWQYFKRYVEKIKVPPKGVFIRGKALHKTTQTYWSLIIEGLDPVSTEEAKSMTADTYDSLVESERPVFEDDAEKGKLKDEAITATELYLQELAPMIGTPIAVEQEVVWNLILNEDGEVLRILSTLDMIDQYGRIRDNKVMSKSPKPSEADDSLQLSVYAMAYRDYFGEPEAGVALDCMILNKTPKTMSLDSYRSERDFVFLKEIFAGAYRQIQSGIFYPNPTCMFCNEQCGYYQYCSKSLTRKKLA